MKKTRNRKKDAKPVAANQDVDKGAKEVVEFLKGSKLAASGKESVYSLPWYIVAGTPKSGKSSLVLSSGLNFQPLPSQRQSEQKLIRPTREVDWRVTSEAVFVDTAGRFQTEGGDEDEWTSIMETIKKHRQKRPIDGFLLAVSAERILKSDRREIEEFAKIVRTRLDEATKVLKTKFPVYLVFTNADAIEGFRDSFSASKKESENLVWGTTIPLEKSDNAQALFDGEYEILQDSVMKRRLIRLSAPFSPTRQLRIFNFPLHFSSARRKLGSFVTTLFRPNPFSESPFLRGFYFTASPVERSKTRGKQAANIGQTVGKSYFTKKFFSDVVLRDKDLVKTFQDQKQKAPILGWLTTILGTLLVLGLLGLSGFSLYSNKALINDAQSKADAVLTIIKADTGNKNPLTKPENERRKEIVAIENLQRMLVKLDDYERNGAPWYMRFGFYSGNRLYKERLLNIYYTAVEPRFVDPTKVRLEQDLRQFAQSSPATGSDSLSSEQEEELGKKYALLATYLMWAGEKDTEGVYRAESTFMSNSLEEIWVAESKVPADLKETAKSQLNFYFKQTDRNSSYSGDFSTFPRISTNESLVAEARKKLKAFPPYLRYLKRETTDASKKIDAVSVNTLLASETQDTIEGDYEIAGAYTIEGYRKIMKEKIANAAEELGKPDWVMGEKTSDATTTGEELKRLETKYFNEYTDKWRSLVKSVKIRSYSSPEEMEQALNAFSSTSSPMKKLFEEIAKNTNLSAEPEAQGWIDWITSFWSRRNDENTGGTSPIEQSFRPLFPFVGSGAEKDAGSPPIAAYGNQIQKLGARVITSNATKRVDIGRQLANDSGKDSDSIKRIEQNVAAMLNSFRETPAGQEIMNVLLQPLTNTRSFLGGGVIDRVRKEWTEKVLPRAREIESGYPFDSAGEADLAKLTAFLNPVNGTFKQFYDTNLNKYFEEVDGKLQVKASTTEKFSEEFISYLNNVRRLQKTLFAGNASPSFEYDFRLLPVKDAIVEITIDGQNVRSEGTGSVKLKFPAAAGQSTGVLMRYTSDR